MTSFSEDIVRFFHSLFSWLQKEEACLVALGTIVYQRQATGERVEPSVEDYVEDVSVCVCVCMDIVHAVPLCTCVYKKSLIAYVMSVWFPHRRLISPEKGIDSCTEKPRKQRYSIELYSVYIRLAACFCNELTTNKLINTTS